MTRDEHDDPIYDLLSELDPIGHDAPPAVGSPRFITIKENAMQTITNPASTTEYRPVTAVPGRGRGPRRRYSRALLGAAAATVALVAGTIIVVDPAGAPSAEALVLEAADNLARYDALRATLVRDHVDGSLIEGTAEVDGQSIRTELVEIGADGQILSSEGITVIGDTIWTDDNGEIFEQPTGPNDRLTPFHEASRAVITAALAGTDVERLGSETIRETTSQRYRIVQTAVSRAALNELTPFELAWFELEYPDAVTQIDVWIADDVIHQITVVDPSYGTTTTTFYDFGANIDITPPQD